MITYLRRVLRYDLPSNKTIRDRVTKVHKQSLNCNISSPTSIKYSYILQNIVKYLSQNFQQLDTGRQTSLGKL